MGGLGVMDGLREFSHGRGILGALGFVVATIVQARSRTSGSE